MFRGVTAFFKFPHQGRSIAAAIACFMISAFAVATSLLTGVDHFILEKRFEALSRVEQANVIIVEIDTKSLQAMPAWPWPRAVYGDLVNVLDAAGVTGIAFDVDFSSPGDPDSNRVFAEAIANADADIYLATLRQPISADMPDITAEILPHPDLRGAANLAAVNYPMDSDGILRRAVDSIEFSFGAVPTFASALAKKDPVGDVFYIDYSISPQSIQRISFSDVLQKNFDREFFTKKNVLIGASALELGDAYAIPVHGIQSGVLVNALAYETVRKGGELHLANIVFILLTSAALCALLTSAICNKSLQRAVTVNAVAFVVVGIVPAIIQSQYGYILNTAVVHLAQILCLMYSIGLELEKRAQQAFYARMQAKENHAILQTLITDNHEGFIVANRFGRIEMCNKRAQDLLGLEKLPEVGDEIDDIEPELARHVESAGDGTGVIRRFVLEKEVPGENHQLACDVTMSRSKMPLANSPFERRTEGRIYIVFALHDITAQKNAELAERAAKESHAEISAAKTQLISTMNHELRTPLNSVIGFADILQQESLGPLGNHDYVEYADLIGTSGRHLLSILNDMLHATQLQAGEKKIQADNILPTELFEEALEEVRAKKSWAEQQVTINVPDETAKINIDWGAMKLALMHLLDNAAKFAGPSASIQLEVAEIEDKTVLSVRDDGPGCPAEKLPALTEIFYQADSALNRSFEGCGLGLYLAQNIVALHDGDLILSSVEGDGFKAEIILPPSRSVRAVPKAA